MHPESFLDRAQAGLKWFFDRLPGRLFPVPAGVTLGAGPCDAALETGRYLNSGGPRSRQRTEQIRTSLFPRGRWRESPLEVRRFGKIWEFPGVGGGLREAAYEILTAQGFGGPEEAFAKLEGLPRLRLHCRSCPRPKEDEEDKRASANPLEALRCALVLGKCSNGLYDPQRPLVWTEKRLEQRLELYELCASFYDLE